MGQQQLLLVILVTVVVGVATVVATDTLQQSRTNANKSAVRQDMMIILNDALLYYQKPEALGGGGQSFSGITLSQIHSVKSPNKNGSYQLNSTKRSLTVNGINAATDDTLLATATMTDGDIVISWEKNDN